MDRRCALSDLLANQCHHCRTGARNLGRLTEGTGEVDYDFHAAADES